MEIECLECGAPLGSRERHATLDCAICKSRDTLTGKIKEIIKRSKGKTDKQVGKIINDVFDKQCVETTSKIGDKHE